jgi:hypothetical protein
MAEILKPDFFRRLDESEDELFYQFPRMVVHIDDGAIAKVGEIYAEPAARRRCDSGSHVELAVAFARNGSDPRKSLDSGSIAPRWRTIQP